MDEPSKIEERLFTYLKCMTYFRNFDFAKFPSLHGCILAPLTDESYKIFDAQLVKTIQNVLRTVRDKSPPTPEMIQGICNRISTLDDIAFE